MINQELDITNLGTWLHDNNERVFRIFIYKKIFTPREQKECYCDESVFENAGYPLMARIESIIETPGDFLLELILMEESDGYDSLQDAKPEQKEYLLFSNIRMESHEVDQIKS